MGKLWMCVCMFNLQNYWGDFDKIWYRDLHWNLSDKFNFNMYLSVKIQTLYETQIEFYKFLKKKKGLM